MREGERNTRSTPLGISRDAPFNFGNDGQKNYTLAALCSLLHQKDKGHFIHLLRDAHGTDLMEESRQKRFHFRMANIRSSGFKHVVNAVGRLDSENDGQVTEYSQ